VAFRTNGYDLVAALADGRRMLLRYANAAPGEFTPSRIDAFEFDDATLTLAQVQALATDFVAGDSLPSALTVPAIGTAGADALGGTVVHGLDGNDHLSGNRQVGGPGDDVLDDPDTVVFGRGDGHDTVTLYNSWSKQAVSTLPSWIEMQPGISASDLAFGIEGRDLVVTIRDTGDSVTVRRHFELRQLPELLVPVCDRGRSLRDGTTMASTRSPTRSASARTATTGSAAFRCCSTTSVRGTATTS
jgi:hypothetical protein